MDFELNEEQRAFAQTAQQFAQESLMPMAAQWDEDQVFPKDGGWKCHFLLLGSTWRGWRLFT